MHIIKNTSNIISLCVSEVNRKVLSCIVRMSAMALALYNNKHYFTRYQIQQTILVVKNNVQTQWVPTPTYTVQTCSQNYVMCLLFFGSRVRFKFIHAVNCLVGFIKKICPRILKINVIKSPCYGIFRIDALE